MPTIDSEIALENRRRRTRRRMALAFLAGIAGLALVRAWWGWEAGRRLTAELARLRTAGEPIDLDDFNRKVRLPDDQNAAAQYQAAIRSLSLLTNVSPRTEELLDDAQLAREHGDAVAALLNANAAVLRSARAARALPDSDWGVRFRRPAMNMLLPQLSQARRLAKFLRIAAIHQFDSGVHAEAIETCRDLGALAERVGDPPATTLINRLVSIAIQELEISAIELITPALRLRDPADGAAGGPASDGAASREQIDALVAELLDERAVRDAWASGNGRSGRSGCLVSGESGVIGFASTPR
ncbi:hypothetical protein RAS1_10720 [Phycisphaerae bacterium RAS1]|nr:hypothetical protein RAS1_10720 [Phycisphaerae bacterium RAS1]